MPIRRVSLFAAALAASAVLSACAAGTSATAAAPSGTIPLTIKGAKGSHVFNVEVARTPEEQERGLMFRANIPADGGMIFPFPVPRIASFWMKNTIAPLDMIFIRPDGTISSIAANTVPYSLTPVVSTEPVKAVLEIAGGRAAELGISEGDRVSWAQ